MSLYGNNTVISSAKASIVGSYWIPSENEWYKAAYYDPTLNNGLGGYWTYATQSNTPPTAVIANSTGDGLAGAVGNFANYDLNADWNNQDGNVTTVGTNGGPSYYGAFDMCGNVLEWTDTISGSSKITRGGRWVNSNISTLASSYRTLSGPTSGSNSFGFRVASSTNPLYLSNFISIGNIGNSQDSITGNLYGSVNYEYYISKYEITNNEYTDFLNSIATTDTYSLYHLSMGSDARGGISRSGSSGSYVYTVKTNMGNKPVNYISWFRAARYCNWLTNHKTSGYQNSSTTEDGIYTLNGAISGIISKNS